MKLILAPLLSSLLPLCFVLSCDQNNQRAISSHEKMVRLLKNNAGKRDKFNSAAKLLLLDSLLALKNSAIYEVRNNNYLKANVLLELGREKEAIQILESLIGGELPYEPPKEKQSLALAYLRQGERSNCIVNHAAESCIMPTQGVGIYSEPDWSRKAIELYTDLLTKSPDDLESRWLLNFAYMTLGEYPKEVPEKFFIPGLEGDTTHKIKPFADVASSLNLDISNMAGGSIVEDFDNDGYLDIMTSSWGANDAIHFFKNNANGTFSNLSDKVGLNGITGGLNIIQADYNNDGYQDVFVLRGAWKMEYGNDPNSLLRNNGDGTFTDVTIASGFLSFHPTQTATWNDFNNDGWVDLFIGNESEVNTEKQQHPCELYINNQNGTFREVAGKANCSVVNYVKGVTSGDYDNDGWQDIFISTLDGERKLLRNNGAIKDGDITFEDVTKRSGLDKAHNKTFPTWFWDYNNDGWLDIFTCDFTLQTSLAYSAAADKMGLRAGSSDKTLLYKNNKDGTFTNVAEGAGLNKFTFAMGSNFGDVDNDGYLDMYLGTGNPMLQAIIPNKMFRNINGEKFVDVTSSARVGHIQKGHAVSFADVDNDGDQDVHIHMGGAFPGDAYQNSFFLNPGQNDNNWIGLILEGVKSNRSAIGTRIKITFKENGISRSVYRDVNSGGSFGASPLRREIGLGSAKKIDQIEIRWHGSNDTQIFNDVMINQFIKIREGRDEIIPVSLNKLSWVLPEKLCYPDGQLIN
jgi:hypothetical protein